MLLLQLQFKHVPSSRPGTFIAPGEQETKNSEKMTAGISSGHHNRRHYYNFFRSSEENADGGGWLESGSWRDRVVNEHPTNNKAPNTKNT